jgi:hypothetical protein
VAAQMRIEAPSLRDTLVEDVNHYTTTLDERGAKAAMSSAANCDPQRAAAERLDVRRCAGSVEQRRDRRVSRMSRALNRPCSSELGLDHSRLTAD